MLRNTPQARLLENNTYLLVALQSRSHDIAMREPVGGSDALCVRCLENSIRISPFFPLVDRLYNKTPKE